MSISARFYLVENPENADAPLVLTAYYQLHLPLSLYSRWLADRYAKTTRRIYLRSLITYFSWLVECFDEEAWNETIEDTQAKILRYLTEQFSCRIKKHRRGFQTVRLTENNLAALSQFLASLRSFYDSMISAKLFCHTNPLIGIQAENRDDTSAVPYPRMPLQSGVVENIPKKRLTDAYFVLTNQQWMPQVIDDPDFPKLIFSAGEQFGWKAREYLIARLLFETGARISEVCGLTLGDWLARGAGDSATAFSKGSFGRRVKFLRWSSRTTKLLRMYITDERVDANGHSIRLSDYAPGCTPPIDPFKLPLFSSRLGTQLLPSSFRDLYWRPAMQRAQIMAHIHQTRHWYVTMSIREIYSSGESVEDINRQTVQLIKYMNWRSGKTTLDAYEHFFDRERHAQIQDILHQKFDESLCGNQTEVVPEPKITKPETDADFDYLMRLGGHLEK